MHKTDILTLSEDEIWLANIFKALGNPTRLAILKHLSACQPCKCGNIVADLPLAQSTVSQHLKVLREAGLIRGTIERSAICYCIDIDTLNRFRQIISEMNW